MIEISDEEEDLESHNDSLNDSNEFGPIEFGQKRIIVKYGDLQFPVNWDEEQPLEDVKEMIICACDSIIDSGFEILSPETGNVFNLKDVASI